MDLKQTLKAILVGFCLGVGLTWLLAAILPLTMGADPAKFIHACSEDIASFSVLGGGFCSFVWLVCAILSRRRRRREELEDAMTEYFRKKNREAEED